MTSRRSLLEWAKEAACSGVAAEEPDMFFPDERNQKAIKKLNELYCDKCPVKIECKYEAVYSEHSGIWGGISTATRNVTAKMYGLTQAPI